MNYLVIDFGGTLVKYSVMDEQANIHEKGEQNAPVQSKEAYLKFTVQLYKQMAEKIELCGIAISMPGVIDVKTGYLYSAGAYQYLQGMNVFEELKDEIPIPISVENDGKCGALAEVWKGGLRENQDGIVIILGTGVGGGIIKDRKVHKGREFIAGEFSYLIMDDTYEYCGSAAWKCGVAPLLFEANRKLGIDVRKSTGYQVFHNLVDCTQTITDWNDKPEYTQGLNGYQFFELLEQGNEIIAELYQKYTSNIARLLLNLQLIYSPEKILIGGGVSRQQRLIPDIQKEYEKWEKALIGGFLVPHTIETCQFGNEANQYGALYHFLNRQ